MWHPEPFVKHSIPTTHPPTAEEAAGSRWFSPLDSGRLVLTERTWVPAMVPWRATDDGFVTPEVLSWYERFARGQPGALVVEATGIRDIPSGPLLRIGHDRFIPGLAELVRVVRRASGGRTRLFIQIIDFLRIRRRPEPERYFREFLHLTDRHRSLVPGSDADVRDALARLPEGEWPRYLSEREIESLRYGERERVTDIELPQIQELPRVLPELFAGAAVRAETAGFDGVELHYAHAYTMASFLSALNQRDDGFGGTRANRMKLPLEVYRAVRSAVSQRFVVGVRFLGEECIPGGNTPDDAAFFGAEFARAGMDYLSLSRGGKFEDAKQPRVGWSRYPYTGPSGYECMPTVRSDERGPFGRNRAATRAIRDAVRAAGYDTPVVMSGGISTYEQAEELLRNGVADIIASARQSLADPDWFRKLRLGLGDEVRRCVFTNYCEGLDQVHKPVTCKLWDHVDLGAADTPRTADGRRRLVAPAWEPAAR
ncbi:MAG TPA: NADH:flavin oxidoreductase [Gemmatimonadales bacterium]|jgi:2,4-dienoyl-CoA reductase-like NADH-dependent reductase (Old Yellow Enzyme family)